MKKKAKRNPTRLTQDELFFLGKLEAARGLRKHAREAEDVWLNQGRKEGLDVDKLVQILNAEEKEFRRKHPDRAFPPDSP